MLRPEDNLLDYIDDYVHGLLPPADARTVERFCAHSKLGQAALEAAQQRQAMLQSLSASEPSEALIAATVERIERYATQRAKLRKYFGRTVMFVAAAAATIIGAFNLYYYRLEPSPFDLHILGQSRLLAASPASLRVALFNRTNGRPLGGVPIRLALHNPRNRGTVELARVTTDESGGASPKFDVPDWASGSYELRITAQPDGQAENLVRPVNLTRDWKLLLSTDKPVYQPGQTIHIRSLALKRPQLKPVIGERVAFSVTDPKGNVVFRKTDLSSKFGIASTDCTLATEILEGPYAIDCRVGETASQRTVQVEKYVLPKFKVAVALDKPFYAPSDEVRCRIQSDYFFGKPVAGGTVKVEVRGSDVQAYEIATLDGKTDEQGHAELTFRLPRQMLGRPQDDGQARFALLATVTDTAGQQSAQTASRVVTADPIRLEIFAESGTLVGGVPNTIYICAGYADGQPAEVSLLVQGQPQELQTNNLGIASLELTPAAPIVNLTVQATDRQGRVGRKSAALSCGSYGGDFLVRTDKAIYSGGDTLTLTVLGSGGEPVFVDLIKDGQTVLTTSVEIQAGRGRQEVDLPPDLFGTIELCAYRYGLSGLAVRKTRLVYVEQARQLAVQATFDADEYRPGAKAKLKLKLADKTGQATPGAISLSAVDEAVFSVLDQRPGLEATYFLLEQELLKPVYVVYPGWSPELFTELPFVERNKFQQAVFSQTCQSAFGNQLSGPGQSPFTLNATTYFDKAQRFFQHRHAALQRVMQAWWSLAGSLLLAGIVGLALFYPREFVKTSLIAALFTTCLGVFLVGLIVLFLLLTALGCSAGSPAPKSAADAARTEPAAAAKAPRSQAPDKEDKSVDSSAGTSPAPTDTSKIEPPRVRKFFPETLLWRPELITDDRGEAQLDIELADSITTWRLSASAVSATGQLGAGEFPLRVFQPFFVDLNLPVVLTRNDEVGVPVIVYNYLDKPQTVELELQDGDWFQRLDTAPPTSDGGMAILKLELNPGEIRSLTLPLRVLKAGVHQLQVTARGSGVADALRREVEVVPDGQRVERVASGALTAPYTTELAVPDDAIDGSIRAIVKIYPSSFSQVVEGLEAIFRMPSGCFEQTSSTTYPNVLALDYLRRTNKSVPQVEAKAREYIHLGYQRLVSFEVPGGGFDWFGRPPANRTLTAYGLMEFEDMARVHDVDPQLIERTRQWLLAQRRPNGSWSNESGMLNDGLAASVNRGGELDLAATAYIGGAVFGSGRANAQAGLTLDYLLAQRPESIQDPYLLAVVTSAIAAIDRSHSQLGAYLSRLDALKTSSADGKLVWWQQTPGSQTAFHGRGQAGNIETTALATLALLNAGQVSDTARGALTWLVSQKDAHGTWHSTQATVLALKALLAGTGAKLGSEQERRVELTLGDQRVHEFVIPVDQADVMAQFDFASLLKPGQRYSVQLTDRSDTSAGYQLAFRYHVPGPPIAAAEAQERLAVDIAYDRQRLQVDETVTAVAKVVNRLSGAAPMVILDLPIPGGFVIEPSELDELVGVGRIAKYQITARKAIVYLRELQPNQSLELRYRLKATMPVKVAVPAAQVYEYYDPANRGSGGATQLEAVKA